MRYTKMKQFLMLQMVILSAILVRKVESQQPNLCSNNNQFQLHGGFAGTDSLTCTQIRDDETESRRVKLCQEPQVRENCPQTCGICCTNDPFFAFMTNQNEEQNCQWLSAKEVRVFMYCKQDNDAEQPQQQQQQQQQVADACQKSCNACMPFVKEDNNDTPSELENTTPTPPPTISPSNSLPIIIPPTASPAPSPVSCADDSEFLFRDKHSCTVIQRNENKRQTFCQHDAVRDACPTTCGLCCQNDKDYIFSTNASSDLGQDQKCDFLVNSETKRLKFCDRYSNGQTVKNACRLTCDNCLSLVEQSDPVLPPTKESTGEVSSSERGETLPEKKSPAYLGVLIFLCAIALFAGLYSVYDIRKREYERKDLKIEQLKNDLQAPTDLSEVRFDGSQSIGSLSGADSSVTSVKTGITGITGNTGNTGKSSFVAATISDLGRTNISQANVHKCENFPCVNCHRERGISFIRAPKVDVERDRHGCIEFIPVPVDFIGEEYTQEVKPMDTLSHAYTQDSREGDGSTVICSVIRESKDDESHDDRSRHDTNADDDVAIVKEDSKDNSILLLGEEEV